MLNKAEKFGNMLVLTTLVFPLIILEHIGHVFDVLTTWYAITKCGAREANILMAWLVESSWKLRWFSLSAIKFWVVNRSHPITRTYKRSYDLKYVATFTAMIWCVVAWNFSVIIRRKHAAISS